MAKEWVKPAYWCKVDTERGRKAQERRIEASKERLARKTPMLKGDNFYFVCWGDVTELKLWEKRENGV